MKEIWKPVTRMARYNECLEIVRWIDLKGMVSVSNLGNIKRANGTIPSTKPDKRGYVVVCIEHNRFRLQQVIMQTFHPEGIKDGVSVDHINRNTLNNNLSNLRWATKDIQFANRENKAYKYKKVKCLNNGMVYNSCQEAEALLGITRNTVARVARGERKNTNGYNFVFV